MDKRKITKVQKIQYTPGTGKTLAMMQEALNRIQNEHPLKFYIIAPTKGLAVPLAYSFDHAANALQIRCGSSSCFKREVETYQKYSQSILGREVIHGQRRKETVVEFLSIRAFLRREDKRKVPYLVDHSCMELLHTL
jgi:hypothetical protein